MSHTERELVRPRRRVNPPAYFRDYELSGCELLRQQTRSPSDQSVQEDETQSSSGQSRSSTPVIQASEKSEWKLTDQWDGTSERLRQENAALQRQVKRLPEITTRLKQMEQENAALQQQASQLTEIISTVQEMRQQNVALHQELQNLKSDLHLRYPLHQCPHHGLTYQQLIPRLHIQYQLHAPSCHLLLRDSSSPLCQKKAQG